jgi:hypothetical protein
VQLEVLDLPDLPVQSDLQAHKAFKAFKEFKAFKDQPALKEPPDQQDLQALPDRPDLLVQVSPLVAI